MGYGRWLQRVLAIGLGIVVIGAAPIGTLFVSEAAESPWEQTGGPTGAPMESVVISPTNPLVLYSAGYGGGVYKSTNGGEKWVLQPIRDYKPEEQLRSLVLNPAAPDTLYVVGVHGVSKSTDGGATWAASNSGIRGCHLNVTILVMDPTSPITLYIGTTHCPGDSPGALYKSTDGGRRWTDITGLIDPHVFDEVCALGACGSEVYAGLRDTTGNADGEVYHSSDGGKTWSQVILDDQQARMRTVRSSTRPIHVRLGSVWGAARIGCSPHASS
jgi:photosystem II stability/assembly factor-like uncharacterized protein